MEEKIYTLLTGLRRYALDKGYEVSLFYQEEDSCLMRFANSAISLNTNEHLIRLRVTAYAGRKRASVGLITDLAKIDEMNAGIDTAAAMAEHAMPLTYTPTIPVFSTSFSDASVFDPALAGVRNDEKLAYINEAVQGMETDDIRLSGIFSSGTNTTALINTRSEHTLYFKTSDAQISAVLSHTALKWEISAEQSARARSDLHASSLKHDLAFLLKHYRNDSPQQLPIGSYDIVFGSAAVADLLTCLGWIAYSGGAFKRGFSCMTEEMIGKKIFSDKIDIIDDPDQCDTFPCRVDMTGISRKPFPLFTQGVFRGFLWSQDDADEFGAKPTGHTVPRTSIILHGGEKDVDSLAALAALPRDKDILYIPCLHYMNVVNPSKAIITGSSRFGALLLKQDGSVAIPYNVRLTQSLLDIFGDNVAWLSATTAVRNTSNSYGPRNPTAIIVPQFMCVNNLGISHSNPSY